MDVINNKIRVDKLTCCLIRDCNTKCDRWIKISNEWEILKAFEEFSGFLATLKGFKWSWNNNGNGLECNLNFSIFKVFVFVGYQGY